MKLVTTNPHLSASAKLRFSQSTRLEMEAAVQHRMKVQQWEEEARNRMNDVEEREAAAPSGQLAEEEKERLAALARAAEIQEKVAAALEHNYIAEVRSSSSTSPFCCGQWLFSFGSQSEVLIRRSRLQEELCVCATPSRVCGPRKSACLLLSTLWLTFSISYRVQWMTTNCCLSTANDTATSGPTRHRN